MVHPDAQSLVTGPVGVRGLTSQSGLHDRRDWRGTRRILSLCCSANIGLVTPNPSSERARSKIRTGDLFPSERQSTGRETPKQHGSRLAGLLAPRRRCLHLLWPNTSLQSSQSLGTNYQRIRIVRECERRHSDNDQERLGSGGLVDSDPGVSTDHSYHSSLLEIFQQILRDA